MRAVLSTEAVTMRLPSGEYAADSTQPWWPLRTVSEAPLAASQIRAVLSNEAVTIRVPSGE